MKYLNILAVFFVSAVIGVSTHRQIPRFLEILPKDDTKCVVNTRKCSDDCSGIILCPSTDKPVKVRCSDQSSGALPYCNTETFKCDSVQKCQLPTDDTCNFPDAFYPDLLDCTKYYYCKTFKKIRMDCEPKKNYNPVKQNCDATTACYTFTGTGTGRCAGKAGKLVAHPLAKYMYVYCGSMPTLFICPAGKEAYYEFDFDEKTAGCNLMCKAECKFAAAKEEYYYQCTKSASGTFTGTIEKCPDNFKFQADPSGVTGHCIPKGRSLL